jgi:hypothetical protein
MNDKEKNTPQEFKNAKEVVAYLKSQGYKISVATFYTHRKQFNMYPDVGKYGYSYKKVLDYAKQLKVEMTLQKKEDEEYGREQVRLKNELTREQISREKIRRLKEEGELIDKKLVYLRYANVLTGIYNSMHGQAQIDAGEAAELIMNSDDKPRKFVEVFIEIMDRTFNDFSKLNNLEAVFGEES